MKGRSFDRRKRKCSNMTDGRDNDGSWGREEIKAKESRGSSHKSLQKGVYGEEVSSLYKKKKPDGFSREGPKD